jgi:TPR repeat protein
MMMAAEIGKRAGAMIALVFLMLAPALAFDGTPSSAKPAELSANESLKLGTKAYRAGNIQEAINRWTAAAEAGQAVAQWRLGRAFAEGKGVPKDDKKAFHWFKQIVDDHADEEPGSMQGQLAGRAFVELGSYYRSGIPDSEVGPDINMAWRMYYQAASVFGDSEAQYQLGYMYLEGKGVEKNQQLAVNWLRNAAEKCHMRGQALLGDLLFSSAAEAPRRRVEGLMWLSIARNQAKSQDDAWVVTSFEDAYTLASDQERMDAANNVKRWQKQASCG